MKMSSAGLDLVKSFEGLYTKAYRCPAGVWTIGYGHTGKVDGKSIYSGMKITKAKATKLLASDMHVFEKGVEKLVKRKINQHQFDALVSFAFNVGLGNLQKSTLLKYVNQGKFTEAAGQFLLWNKANGKVLSGLTRRRTAEKKLFLKPIPKKVSMYTQTKFVKDLQKLANLKQTGKASSALIRVLPFIRKENSEYIKPLKKILKRKGYSIKTINTKWDNEISSAIIKYKKTHDFKTVNSSITEEFWKKILKY